MHMIKDVLNVPKISITHFRPKSKLRSFAFARQYTHPHIQYICGVPPRSIRQGAPSKCGIRCNRTSCTAQRTALDRGFSEQILICSSYAINLTKLHIYIYKLYFSKMNVERSAIVFLYYSGAFNIHFTKRKFV